MFLFREEGTFKSLSLTLTVLFHFKEDKNESTFHNYLDSVPDTAVYKIKSHMLY